MPTILTILKYGSLIKKLIFNLPTIIVAIDSLVRVVNILRESGLLSDKEVEGRLGVSSAVSAADNANALMPLMREIDSKCNR